MRRPSARPIGVDSSSFLAILLRLYDNAILSLLSGPGGPYRMRAVRLLLVATVTLAGGCSSMIARSGTDLFDYTTREEMRKEFGEPVKSGHEDGRAYEEFYSRRKLTDPWRVYSTGMALVFTFGLIEPIAFPYEVFRLGYTTAVGQQIRVYYEADGSVVSRHIDGEELTPCPWVHASRLPATPSSPTGTPKPETHSAEGGTMPKSTSPPE
jgi:hypothetical protein